MAGQLVRWLTLAIAHFWVKCCVRLQDVGERLYSIAGRKSAPIKGSDGYFIRCLQLSGGNVSGVQLPEHYGVNQDDISIAGISPGHVWEGSVHILLNIGSYLFWKA